MALFLNSNATSVGAQRNFNNVTSQLNKTIGRLSSGLKINSGADGGASLGQADAFSARVRGFGVAETNIQQGQAVLNIADSALQTIRDDLQRMREVALEAANGTVTDYTNYNAEVADIVANIDAVATGTTFGTNVLLNGSVAAFSIQAGAESGATNQVDLAAAFADSQAAALLGAAATTITDSATAMTLLGQVDTALTNVAGNLANIGQFQNQLSNRLEFAQISKENYVAAEGAIRNADVAAETSKLTQQQVLQQASALALSQANNAPNIALQLLRG